MTATVVFDGECGFCTRCADWLRRRAPAVVVVAWQRLDLAAHGLTEAEVREAAWWLEDGRPVDRAEGAVARALVAAGRGWAVAGRVLLLPGVRRVAGVGYRFVARHRSRLPGTTPECRRDPGPG